MSVLPSCAITKLHNPEGGGGGGKSIRVKDLKLVGFGLTAFHTDHGNGTALFQILATWRGICPQRKDMTGFSLHLTRAV